MRNFIGCLTFAVILSACASAGGPASAPAPGFSWLSGHWCSQDGDELIEEFWMPPSANLIIGVGRTVRGGVTVTFEFMRIVTRDGVTSYLAEHDGQPAVDFRLTASGPGWARFENPRHDFPRRVEYRRNGAVLHAEIAGPGEGGEVVIPFEYRACGS